MKTLAKYHACNHCVIAEKTFKNILIGPGKLPELSRKRAPAPFKSSILKDPDNLELYCTCIFLSQA